MRSVTIDCATIHSEQEFWQRYVDAAQPQGAEIFGRNLDAFEDALDGGPGFPGDAVVTFTHSAHLRKLRNGRFLAALAEIASEHPNVILA